MNDPSSDTSGVGFPPPLLYAGGFVAGVGAHRLLPVRVWPEPPAITSLLGWGLLVVGVLLVASAAYLFRRAGTTPNPTKPTSALVIWDRTASRATPCMWAWPRSMSAARCS